MYFYIPSYLWSERWIVEANSLGRQSFSKKNLQGLGLNRGTRSTIFPSLLLLFLLLSSGQVHFVPFSHFFFRFFFVVMIVVVALDITDTLDQVLIGGVDVVVPIIGRFGILMMTVRGSTPLRRSGLRSARMMVIPPALLFGGQFNQTASGSLGGRLTRGTIKYNLILHESRNYIKEHWSYLFEFLFLFPAEPPLEDPSLQLLTTKSGSLQGMLEAIPELPPAEDTLSPQLSYSASLLCLLLPFNNCLDKSLWVCCLLLVPGVHSSFCKR